MNTINTSGSTGASMYGLKQAEKLNEKVVSQLMESLPQVTQTAAPQSSPLAKEGIGANLDLKG
jgi:hypothetical protein